MQRVLVLNQDKIPLMPCNPARARMLFKTGRAKLYRRFPFTIILVNRTTRVIQPLELKLDPGSHTTGIALAATFPNGRQILWAANLRHRGEAVRSALLSRRQNRRNRRSRKTRYRAPRFDNRVRSPGWLPPSIQSRVDNIHCWVVKLLRFCPSTALVIEMVRFDPQILNVPASTGLAYQPGTPLGYEVREYLLEKFNRTCVYCGAQNTPLEIDHVQPKSRGGTPFIIIKIQKARPAFISESGPCLWQIIIVSASFNVGLHSLKQLRKE